MPNHSIQAVIQRIGETDQLFLQGNSAELALERANLRLELVLHSQSKREQVHFLQEAIVLLEQARIEFEDLPIPMFIELSLHLAKAYMLYFEISQETRFALITQQILKPLSQFKHGDIYFFLAYAAACQKEFALTQHWLKKCSQTEEFDVLFIQQHQAFQPLQTEIWFQQLIKNKLH